MQINTHFDWTKIFFMQEKVAKRSKTNARHILYYQRLQMMPSVIAQFILVSEICRFVLFSIFFKNQDLEKIKESLNYP